MRVALVQFDPWDKVYHFDPRDLELKTGNKVIVRTELGQELGEIVGFKEIEAPKPAAENPEGAPAEEIKPVVRLASSGDIEKVNNRQAKSEALEVCRELVKKYNLPMKLVDVRFAYEGERITFAFIADSRVDFRELVKELTRRFNSAIRLQQIGIRDEARMMGDFGHCGRKLCCGNFLRNLESITSDMADIQGIAGRGSERISGICGRLMCCLAFESSQYKELAAKLPPVGAEIKVNGKTGVVVQRCILKGSVNVRVKSENGNGFDGSIVEVKIN